MATLLLALLTRNDGVVRRHILLSTRLVSPQQAATLLDVLRNLLRVEANGVLGADRTRLWLHFAANPGEHGR